MRGNLRMALKALRRSKARSLLTMFGIIIAVASVLIIASLGRGVENQVARNIDSISANSVSIRSGKPLLMNDKGSVTGFNTSSLLASSTLSENDLNVLQKTKGIAAIAPVSYITGSVAIDDKKPFDSILIVATNENFLTTTNYSVESGSFFAAEDNTKNAVVIGHKVAESVFGDLAPIGRTMRVRGTDLIVRGVMKPSTSSPINLGVDYNNSIFVPYGMGKLLNGGTLQIREILAKSDGSKDPADFEKTINAALSAAHAGQDDFSILDKDDLVDATGRVASLLITLVSAISVVALVVGCVGITNIMLVHVSERTREIGIRKAVGATNRQIMSQFMAEAFIISLVGSSLGLLLAVIACVLVGLYTTIEPSVNVLLTVVTLTTSTFLGTLFGTAPAVKAARKDPIIALRNI